MSENGNDVWRAWKLDFFRLLQSHMGFPKKEGSDDRRRFPEFSVSCTFADNIAMVEFEALPKPGRRETPKDSKEFDVTIYSAASAVEDVRGNLLPQLRQRIALADPRRARPF
jgi:hypothetical protein